MISIKVSQVSILELHMPTEIPPPSEQGHKYAFDGRASARRTTRVKERRTASWASSACMWRPYTAKGVGRFNVCRDITAASLGSKLMLAGEHPAHPHCSVSPALS